MKSILLRNVLVFCVDVDGVCLAINAIQVESVSPMPIEDDGVEIRMKSGATFSMTNETWERFQEEISEHLEKKPAKKSHAKIDVTVDA